MRAVVFTAPDAQRPHQAVRVVDDWPEPPAPGPGEALVQTRCSALNHLDLWLARGLMGRLEYPRVGGSDACGDVTALGPGVDPAWLGQRVILNAAVFTPEAPRPLAPPAAMPAHAVIGEQLHGVHRERFIAPVANLQALAPDADPAPAAAFGLTFLTAWSMLVGKAGLRSGQSVLITGIGGGVALAALSIARHLACPAIVTSRSRDKLDRALRLGAAHAVLDEGADWSPTVRTLTGGRGVDVAADSIGKAAHRACLKALCRGGAYVTCGATTGGDATTDLSAVFWRQLRILGSTMGTNAEFAQVSALFRAGALAPVIDRVLPAAGAPDAFERLARGEQFGKLVLDWR